jgi:acyl-CoA reductase-like NAD-dependent aldehyde dehydrogenase
MSVTAYKNLVNGAWVGSANTRKIVNPANGQALAVVPDASKQDVDCAIAVGFSVSSPHATSSGNLE